jgi:hypothetical protein
MCPDGVERNLCGYVVGGPYCGEVDVSSQLVAIWADRWQ